MPRTRQRTAAQPVTRRPTRKRRIRSRAEKIRQLPSSSLPSRFDRILAATILITIRVMGVVIFALGAGLLGAVIAGVIVARTTLGIVLKDTGISATEIIQAFFAGQQQSSILSPTTFLVLGTDRLSNRSTSSVLTDTILLTVFSPTTARLSTISIQRDLYIASQSAKINALYQRGNRGDDGAFDPSLIEAVVGSITGIPIDRTIVLDLDAIAAVIDALGGVEVTIERSFVDFRFPRSDVDVNVERDPAKLYETIAFSKGKERMNGERALRFIRSRHSPDPAEGSDDARTRRQQIVIAALSAKLQDRATLTSPSILNALLLIYAKRYKEVLPLSELSRIGWQIVRVGKSPIVVSHTLPVKEATPSGVLTHPGRFPGGAWVYLPVDPSYNAIRTLVAEWLAGTK